MAALALGAAATLVVVVATCVGTDGTPDRRTSATSAVARTATRSPPPTGSGGVRLREVDGGSSYFATFEESLPSHPAYFPIGVWFESVLSRSDVAKDKGAGLNLYVALTADSRLPAISANGMNVIAQYEDWVDQAEAPGSKAIAGWRWRTRSTCARRTPRALRLRAMN